MYQAKTMSAQIERPHSPKQSDEIVLANNPVEASRTDGTDPQETIRTDLESIMSGDFSQIIPFASNLFSFFEEGIEPGMNKKHVSQHLSRKAYLVLSMMAHVARDQEHGPEDHRTVITRRAMDVAAGVILMTPSWKVSAIYMFDTIARHLYMSDTSVLAMIIIMNGKRCLVPDTAIFLVNALFPRDPLWRYALIMACCSILYFFFENWFAIEV